MKFEDKILIDAPCKDVYSFFEKMKENYLAWHQEHIAFEWRKGKGLEVGNVFYFEEEIGGQLLKKETRFTKIIPNQYIEFKMVNWFYRLFIPKMTFIFEEEKGACLFTAQVFLRGIGPLGKWTHRKEFKAVKKHMKEEGINLKRIIEEK
ncbi:SRPBCC family protein [Salibacter halophilus]|uniref:SRPBCC family protein n=1 Tax=Salibacter halophilus TaxID=1803916 RepID=A0A6N6MBZ0_9FLAO|nr:SRPBCC family protein [Salibacter halophilus]KAB1066067.1 SRPBCC family protein [Salibacter halophilus]